jgi:hypothetical protein
MIDQRFMNQLADDMREPEEPVQEVLLAAGPVTSDVNMPFVGTRLNVPRAGQPQPTVQDRERTAVGLLDSLAGALRGAAAQTLGLPGDIRSIIDMIAQEGAEKYLGQRSFATTEEILQDTSVRVPGTNIDVPFPPVLGADVPRRAERQPTVETAQEVGTFLPAPGIPEAVVRGGRLVGRAVQATKNMPVGMSTQMVGEGVSDLGFYSAAKQAVDSIQQPKGTGEQFLKQIEKTPGVKPEEIKWTGLDDFLKSKKTVTKAEVQEYIDKNRVNVEEVQLGGGYATIEKELNKQGYELNVDMDGDWSIFKNNEYVELNELPADLQKFVIENSPGKTETKFSKYTLPGGENYREILLTLPSKNPEFDPKDLGRLTELSNKTRNAAEDVEYKALAQRYDASLRGETNPEFRSQHFDQPNILAHMRVNDRVDADGKKVLFVEEVQSDWHQAGRKKGYQQPPNEARVIEINQRLRELAKSDMENTPEWETLTREKQSLQDRTGVPDAPFKTTWHELALKRAIQVAAEGGYDRIAFTTGKTQAERYDLSKQISRVTYTEAGVLRAYDKSGEMVLSKKLDSPDQIEDYIGKEPAKKLLEKEVGKIEVVPKNVFDGRELSGVDLQVGGEGMKGFYDQILPKFLDKYAKKWDAKVGMTDIQAGDKMEQVKYVDITPKMKESVLTKGQPLFAIGAGGSAVQQEENE